MKVRISNIWLALVVSLVIVAPASVADEIPGNDIPMIQYHIDTGLVLLDPDGLALRVALLDFSDNLTNAFFDNSPDNPLFAEYGGLIPNWYSGDVGEMIGGESTIAEGYTGQLRPWAQISSGLDNEDFLGVRCHWVGGSAWDVVETNVTVVPEPATIVTFDDITTDPVTMLPIPDNYEGFNWDNFYIMDAINYDEPSGYKNSLVSGTYVAWSTGQGSDIADVSIAITVGDSFDFIGGYLTAGWLDDLNVTIEGYRNDALLYSQTVVIDPFGPTWFAPNFTNIDELRFSSFGGTPVPEFFGDGPHFVLDNFTFVPEPATAYPATTFYVDALNGDDYNDGLSPETAFATIQKGIDSANDGDTVIVAPGTYTGEGNRDIDFLGKAITVRSENGPENCIIDCNGTWQDQHRAFYFHNGEDANSILTGLTITNGHARDGGGGIFCLDSSPTLTNCIINRNWGNPGGGMLNYNSNPTLTDCTFSSNSAGSGGYHDWSDGGGMLNYNSNPTLTNCTFSGNSAQAGGGMANYYGSPTITNCIFSSNSADHGGGMTNADGSPTITNCTFSGNSAGWYGGGMSNWPVSNPTLTNCTFSGNSAGEDGGGMSNYESSPTLTNCTFNGNSVGDNGGGMFNDSSRPMLMDCTFTENSADENGGGMFNWGNSRPTLTNCIFSGNLAGNDGGGMRSSGSLTLTNCTFSGNSAYSSGGIYNPGQATGTMTNCILWGNTPEQITGSAVVVYSDIQGGWPGEGNIDADPCFALSTDYHPMPDSPCIDAGTNSPIGGLPESDIEGNPRPLDGDSDTNARADMGAYEYNPNSPSIAVSASMLSFSYVPGWADSAPQTLLIRNCGGATLNWQIIEDCNWIEATPSNGISTGNINEVTLTVDPNNLAPGYYTCILQVRDPNAANSPVTVLVVLHVAGILRVPDDFFTIQAAIDAADDYDTVLVADDTYTGDGNRDIDFKGKAITVRSENGPNNCIIDCQHSTRGFFFENGEDANSVLDGFTITNGYADDGSGILCEQSSPTITDCIISDNVSWGRSGGGAISIFQSICLINNCTFTGNSGRGMVSADSSPTLTNCTFSGNSGGGMVSADSSPTLTNCTFTGNSGRGMKNSRSSPTLTNCTFSGNSGGGMSNTNSNPTLTNCRFKGNSAGNGGGMYNENSGLTFLTNCSITDNSAGNGGGMYNENSGLTFLTNCSISDNSAEGFGGGIYAQHGESEIIDCDFSGNKAFSSIRGRHGGGGAIWTFGELLRVHNSLFTGNKAPYALLGGAGMSNWSDSTLTNCTFSDNYSANDSGEIWNHGSLTLTNCILWGDTLSEMCFSPSPHETPGITVTYSNVQGGWPGEGNIEEDPLFVEPGYWDPNGTPDEPWDDFWVEGDYHLLRTSPCIDAANDANVYTDIEGNIRPFDFPGVDNNGELPEFDMGAYEATAEEAELMILPRVINRRSRQRRIWAWVRLPEGITRDQIDSNEPLLLYPDVPEAYDIEAIRQLVFQNRRRRSQRTSILAFFDKAELMDAVGDNDNGSVELQVVGRFVSPGQYFYGSDTVRINSRRGRPREHRQLQRVRLNYGGEE